MGDSRRSAGASRPRGAPPGEVPNEDEVAREFPEADDVPLREQTESDDMLDENGTDIRQYTGEPVPTEHGTVVPQQMAVGAERTVGGGEFPNAPGTGDRRDRRDRRDQRDQRDPHDPRADARGERPVDEP